MLKNLPSTARNERDVGSIHGSGRSFGVINGSPLQYYCLGNPMDKGQVHGVAKNWT